MNGGIDSSQIDNAPEPVDDPKHGLDDVGIINLVKIELVEKSNVQRLHPVRPRKRSKS